MRAWSSSSILTSIFFKSMKILLSSSKWFLVGILFFMRRKKRRTPNRAWWLETLSYTSSLIWVTNRRRYLHRQPPTKLRRLDKIVWHYAFISSSFFSSSDMNSGNLSIPDKTFNKPCCTKRARILTLYKLKLFLPSNFSTLYFVEAISKRTRK